MKFRHFYINLIFLPIKMKYKMFQPKKLRNKNKIDFTLLRPHIQNESK